MPDVYLRSVVDGGSNVVLRDPTAMDVIAPPAVAVTNNAPRMRGGSRGRR